MKPTSSHEQYWGIKEYYCRPIYWNFIYPEEILMLEYVSLERYQADNQRTCFISIPHTIPIPQATAQLETV